MFVLQQGKRLYDIRRTIQMARMRCLSIEEIIERVPMLWNDANRDELMWRLTEIDFSPPQLKGLVAAMQQLAVEGERIKSRERVMVDRLLRRLLRLLPAEYASIIAETVLDHPRKSRRAVAYSGLRKTGVSVALANKLLGRFCDREKALSLADQFPREFVHAVGRLEDVTLLPELKRMLQRFGSDLEFLSLYTWVLGKLRATEQLEALSPQIERQITEFERQLTQLGKLESTNQLETPNDI